jgi:formate dehydrogenase subunit delta
MNNEHLVKMANQIESFFRSQSDSETAVNSIESHLRRFWDPRMRKAIVAYADGGGEGLGTLAKAAVAKLKS